MTTIGRDLNCMGNKAISEKTFPDLYSVGGNLIIANSGFTKLPSTLKIIGGNVIVSKNDPESLINDLKLAKQNGILKGDILFID